MMAAGSWRGWLRGARGQSRTGRGRHPAPGLRAEWLEDRIAPAGFLFIDYGDNFPVVGGNRVLNTTIGGLRDVANDPTPANRILGTTLTDSAGNSNPGTAVSVTRPGYSAAERAQMLAVIQRAYLPLEITVVELTQAAQALADGRTVAAATSMADVVNTLRGGDAAFRDAYVFAASFIVDPGGANQKIYNNGGGNSPDSPTLGTTSDLAAGANVHDDLALVFASGVGGNFTNTMNNIAHEAGHLFGLQHAITNPSTTAAINQFHQAEIMSYRNTNTTSSSLFTRYPMIRGDGNSPASGTNPVNYDDLGPRNTPAGQPTYYNQLAQDANVGANPGVNFVSGTGANDIITIARSGALAAVTIQAFAAADYSGTAITVPGFPGTTSYSYSIPLDRPIVVYGGDGADRFVIDADLGVSVQIDGMLGTDRLVVNGKNAAALSYTPGATAPNGIDLVPGVGGMTNVVSSEGLLTSGATSLAFRNFETAGSVTVQNVTTVALVTPNSADNLQVLDGPAGSQNRITGFSGGVGIVPLIIGGVANLVVDTATNDGAGPGTDTVAVDVTAGPSSSLVINTGLGGDTVTVNGLGAGFAIPLTVNADGGIDTLRVLNTTATDTPDATNQPDRGTLSAYGGRSIVFSGFEFVTPVAPVLAPLSLSQTTIDENGVVTLSGQFLDPGSLSAHVVDIDWGDGTTEPLNLVVGARSFSSQHAYAQGGIYTLKVTLTDTDNLTATAFATVLVTGAGVQTIDGQQVLLVIGSRAGDRVQINQAGRDSLRVHADFLPDQGQQRSFALPIDQIRVVLLGGDDLATIAGNVAIPALIDGGAGDDHLNAGRAGSVAIGGPGKDMLLGGPANDILIGDDGVDRLNGNSGEDILIGGSTTFTQGPDNAVLTHQAALLAILAEWNSTRSLATRRLNLSGIVNPEFASRLNGPNFLQLGVTVSDDGDADVINGGSDGDWYFAYLSDVLNDFKPGKGDVKAV